MGIRASFLIGYDILKTTVSAATKTILVHLGDAVNQTSAAGKGVLWQHVGFVSRPSKPVAGQRAAQAIAIEGTDFNYVIATKDDRGQALSGSIGDGETCLYAGGSDGEGQARILLKGDNSVNLFSKSPTSGNNTIHRIDGTNEKIEFQAGSCRITIDGVAGTITLTAGSASLVLDGTTGTSTLAGTQAQLRGSVAFVAGDTFTLIGKNALPVPGTFAVFGTGAPGSTFPSSNVYMSPI